MGKLPCGGDRVAEPEAYRASPGQRPFTAPFTSTPPESRQSSFATEKLGSFGELPDVSSAVFKTSASNLLFWLLISVEQPSDVAEVVLRRESSAAAFSELLRKVSLHTAHSEEVAGGDAAGGEASSAPT